VRGHSLVDGAGVDAVREADLDIGVLEPEAGINVRCDLVVGLQDVLDIDVDEVVEGVDVLLDEALHFEESGEQEPFVLGSL
jgi:hypothetical protein